MISSSSTDKVQNNDTSSRPTTANVKNPLLSAAVTGLTFDDFTHNAVLLPAANVVVPVVPPTHNQSFQWSPTTGPTTGYYKNQDNDDMKEKYKVKSIVFGGQESNVAAILDTESFSEINLNQPTEITAQSSSSSSLNRGDLRRSDYNPLENLDENLLTEDPQQQHQTNTKLESAFSPLLQQTTSLTAQLSQLPSVASSVLSSFSNILRGGTLSPTSNVTANEPDIDQEDQVVSGSNIPYLNDISSLNYHQNFIGGSAINEQQQQQQQPSSVIEPPTFYSPTDSVFIGSKLPPPSSSAVTAQGSSIQSDNHYRISAKKKIYAAVPGLNATTTTGQNLPPPPLPINSSLPPPTINSSLPPPPPPSIISETGNYFNNNQIPPPIQPFVNSISFPLPSQPLELPGNSSNYFTDTLGSNQQQQQQQQQYQSLPPQPQPQPTTTPTINNNNNNKFSLTSFFQTPLVNKLQSTINQNFGNFTEPYVKQQSENPNDEIFSISTITSDGGIIPHGITTGYQQQQQQQQKPTAPPPPPINPPSLINPNLFKTKIQSITTQQQQTPINTNEFNPINSPPTLELNAPAATITGSVPINFYQQNTSSIPVAAAAGTSVPFVNNPQHQHQATTVDPQQIVANFNQFSSPIEQISLNSKLPQPQPPPLPLPPPPSDIAKIVGSPPNSGLKNNYRLNKRIPLYKSNLTPSSSSSSVPVQPQLNVHQPTLSFEQTLLPNVIDQSSSSIITHPITQILNPELQIVTNNNIPKSSGQINLDNQPSKIINPSSSSSSSIITNVPNLFVPNIENQLQPSVDVNKIIPDQAQQGGNISQSYQVPTHSDVLFYDSSTPSINQRPFTGEILQQPQQIESFQLPINDELSTESFVETLNTSIDKILLDDNCLPSSQSQQKNHIIPNVGERCIVYGSDTESKDTGFYFDSHTLPSTTINTKVPLLPEEKQSLNFFDIQKPITTNIQQETDQVNNKQLITNWFNQQQQQPSEQSLQQPQSSQQSTGIHRESSTATPFQPIEIFPLTSTSTSTPSITTEKPILLNPIIATAPIDPINFFNNQLLLQSTTTSIDPSSTNLITTDNNNTITTATTESIGQQQQQQQQQELLIDNQQSILQNIFNNQPQSQPQPQPTQQPSELNELNVINKRLQNIQLFNSSSGGLGDNTNLSFVTPSESYSFASNLVEPPSSTQSEFSELADLSLADRTLTQINDDDECSTANNEQLSVQLQIDAQKYFDRIDAIEYQRSNNKIYDQIKTNMEESPNTANEILLSNEEVGGAGSVTTSAMGNNTIQSGGGGGGGIYRPIYKHWFYEKKIIDLKSIWLPFSMVDSMNLEEAFIKQDKETIETDGGRFDVNISLRQKTSIYWNEKPNAVRRCSWFYKGSNLRYIPYEEDIADKLESEYQNAFTTAEWNRTILLDNGEKVVFHGASVMVHFLNYQLAADATNADWSVPSGPIPDRPRIVKRGFDEFNIDDGEPEQVDHLLFMVHGIGAACDLKFRSVEEVVDEFRCNAMQLVQSHYRCASDNGAVGRIEVLPISWHGELHSTESGIDEKLKAITLESIPKLRSFTNDTLLDVLFYTSPVFCQQIMDSVSGSLNRLYRKYCERNPTFHGDVSLAGHSLGSLILFDLLQHQTTTTTIQDPINNTSKINTEEMQQKYSDNSNKCIRGTAGTGQPSIEYPNLIFKPKNFFALGSPIGMFVTIRGIDGLGPDFKLPTTDGFYNIFHPYDPVAYRIEALINSDLSALRPVLIGHHKGRKRMHLELRETMTRVGSDIKQKIVDTFRHTLDKVYSFRMNNRAGVTKAIEQEVDKALEEQLNLDSKEVGTTNASSTSSSSSPLPPQPPTMGGEFDGETDLPLGILNQGKRIDYVLQEAPLEFFNEYLFALTSHVCYWESEDTTLFIIKEIYSSLGIQTDSTIINTADN